MTFSALGSDASAIKVTHISPRGIWLLAQDEELFMPYKDFSWFKEQTTETILNVEELSPRALLLASD